ncbi:MAG TPA: efflux RND transporter periplasmic adaptor subunit [Woeseiaceae bacterium]|nr:efflux RND transporter periplasmic adaptor subunit [Woeseiaceae bacterium]
MTRLLPLALAGLVMTLVAACEKAVEEAPEIVRPVRMLTITTLTGGESLSYPGEILGVQNAELAFEVPGRLVDLPAEEGIEVTEGQLLAKLDPADFQANVDAAQAAYTSAKTTFERFEEVFSKGAISRQDFDNQKREFEIAEANLTTARKALADTELKAPFSGRIGRVYVDNFNNVQAKQSILLLQDLSQLDIIVNVPEQDWQRAKPGLTLAQQTERAKPYVTLPTFPDRRFPARITEVAASADPVTRTFAARGRFDPPEDIVILPGMSATVTVNISTEDVVGLESAVQIPANAVVGGNDGGSYVWMVDGDTMTVSLSPITPGQMSGSMITILEGLSAGDRIAVSGVQQLAEGMQVRELTN